MTFNQPRANEPRYSWTQPVCATCWTIDHPDRDAISVIDGPLECCCKCAEPTMAGIYIRVDPRTIRWPTNLKD